MPLINCKVELKLKWTKHCVLTVVGNDNTNGNPSNINFTMNYTELHIFTKRYILHTESRRRYYLPKGITESYNIIING